MTTLVIEFQNLDEIKKLFGSIELEFIFYKTYVCILVNDLHVKELCNIVNTNIKYIIIECVPMKIGLYIKCKLRFIHASIKTDCSLYLDYAIIALEKNISLNIGFYNNGVNTMAKKYNAGVIPLLCHDGKFYSLFGIDKWKRYISDFGGGHDKIYQFYHGRSVFKNHILGEKMINNGLIDDVILADHISFSHDFHLMDENKLTQLKIGHGDINSKYTAFRELMEESAIVANDNKVTHVFDIDAIYKRFYINHSYIYLGGNVDYGYDTYIIIVEMNDLHKDIHNEILEMIRIIKDGTVNYHNLMMNPTIKLNNNDEMCGIMIMSLDFIIKEVADIDYVNHDVNISNNNPGKWDTNCSNQKLKESTLKLMRNAYMDATIRYKKELNDINNNIEILKSILIPKD